MNDFDTVNRDGFFRGYNSVVWTVVMLQAGGGLVSKFVILVLCVSDNSSMKYIFSS